MREREIDLTKGEREEKLGRAEESEMEKNRLEE